MNEIAEIVKRIQLELCPDNRHYDCNVCTYSCTECWTRAILALIERREKPMVEALKEWKQVVTDSYKSPMPVDRVLDMLDDLIASVLEGK